MCRAECRRRTSIPGDVSDRFLAFLYTVANVKYILHLIYILYWDK